MPREGLSFSKRAPWTARPIFQNVLRCGPGARSAAWTGTGSASFRRHRNWIRKLNSFRAPPRSRLGAAESDGACPVPLRAGAMDGAGRTGTVKQDCATAPARSAAWVMGMVDGDGFEPPRALWATRVTAGHLQPLGQPSRCCMVDDAGFEPATSRLSAGRSAR